MGLLLLFGFVLGAHEGYIALWRTGETSPVRVFPYPVSTLPPADRQALEKGIEVHDDTELARLLEDYLS